MIIALTSGMLAVTKYYSNQLGSSLFEVLLAVILTCSVILGLINLQSILSTNLDQAKKRLRAERIAFQLLDIYPDTTIINLPNNWQYQVTKTLYSNNCSIVKVTIRPLIDQNISQERWFCQFER